MIIDLKSKNLCAIIKTQMAIDCETKKTEHDSGRYQNEGNLRTQHSDGEDRENAENQV